jgi:hypothetical protein
LENVIAQWVAVQCIAGLDVVESLKAINERLNCWVDVSFRADEFGWKN